MASRVRVYMGCSLDGFIAGPDDDLSFLTEPAPDTLDPDTPSAALDFGSFMAQVGALLMGRRTHDVVKALGEWAYGDTPVLVATRRPLEPAANTVSAVQGDIATIIAQAKDAAGEKDVYLDGGDLITQALNAGLVDELIITLIPTLVGGGTRLFDGLLGQTRLQFTAHHTMRPGLIQLSARPRP